MKLNLYVTVKDMERAATFYQAVFQQPPVIGTADYTAFSLEGALYGLFDAAHYPIPAQWGNNCTPNILVDNIDAEYQRIKALNPHYLSEIRQNGPYRLFVFTDIDGTSIEFYSDSMRS